MKPWKWILGAIVLSTLLIMLVACGGPDNTPPPEQEPAEASQTQTEPKPTNTPPATDTPVPTDTPIPADTPEIVGDIELDTDALSGPVDLDSYRSTMQIAITGIVNDQPVEQAIDFVIEYTSDPLAQHVVMSGSGFQEAAGAGVDAIEMYVVGDTMYMQMGEEWLSMPATEGEIISQGLVTPGTLVEDTCGWKKAGDTDIEGVQVQHWTLSKEDMAGCMTPDDLLAMGQLTAAGGDIYVAEDGDYVVQMDLFFEGENLDLGIEATDEPVGQGRMEIHFKMTDVNQPFTIELPEGALASSSMPEDIPIPADAEEVNNMFGMISFMSASTPQEIADYYQAEMPNNGWTEVSSEELGGMFMLEYTKDGRTASLMVNTDDSGKTSVLITVEDSEG